MEMDFKSCRRTDLIELINTQRRTIEMLKQENADLRRALEQSPDAAIQAEAAPAEAAEQQSAAPVAESR